MCGIAGIFSLDGALHPAAATAVHSMTRALAHRGPDGSGTFNDDVCALGHRRLAIIDRAHGQQPMTNEDRTCWVVFNGEIYNHRDLRRRLVAKGHRFRSSADTETIIHAYEQFGTNCVDELEGMFAFAIYDSRRRELFAARDRLGKKPFFYTVLDGMFHFASELPALVRSPFWKGDIDFSTLEGYLSLGYFVAPSTIYRGVSKLEPAHWLRVSRGVVETREYWDLVEFDTDHRDFEALVTDVDATLRQAVHDRLESEVPLGAFLSGGIDSGLTTSYMAEALGDQMVSISVGFSEAGHNELEAASRTARHFKSRHHQEVIEPRLEDVIELVTVGLGEPLADSSAVPTWYLSRAARQYVTVALSGDGGDESFAGYDFRYVPHAIEAAARTWGAGGLAPALGWLGARWPRHPRMPKVLRAGTLLENLSRDPAGAYYSDLTFLKAGEARRLLGGAASRDVTKSPVYQAVTEPYRHCASTDPVQRAEYADLKIYLPNDLLVKLDRMSMAHALEVRCPFLDRRLVELAFRIPSHQKQIGLKGKALLRRLARQRLPEGISQLPKRGFSAPIGQWFAQTHTDLFREELLGSGAATGQLLDGRDLSRRLDAHARGESDHSYALWASWVLERWLQNARCQPAAQHERSSRQEAFVAAAAESLGR